MNFQTTEVLNVVVECVWYGNHTKGWFLHISSTQAAAFIHLCCDADATINPFLIVFVARLGITPI